MKLKKINAEEMAMLKGYAQQRFDTKEASGMNGDACNLLCEVIECVCSENFDDLVDMLALDAAVASQGMANSLFASIVKRAYEHGAACGHAACLCSLGALYYQGTGVVQSHTKAVALYAQAARLGDMQASINLGYCYSYGHGVDVDYGRAYECFARAALAVDSPEGLWKLGDMYRTGKFVAKDEWQAWLLYVKAYELAAGTPLAARPAHHLADLLMTGIPGRFDAEPLKALALYVEAEAGYYAALSEGFSYYESCLTQALAGQMLARRAVRAAAKCEEIVATDKALSGRHARVIEFPNCA